MHWSKGTIYVAYMHQHGKHVSAVDNSKQDRAFAFHNGIRDDEVSTVLHKHTMPPGQAKNPLDNRNADQSHNHYISTLTPSPPPHPAQQPPAPDTPPTHTP